MKKAAFILLLFAMFCSCSQKTQKITVEKLSCEYLKNPLGVDVQNPRFSWKITSGERGISQTAYQIIVGENADDVKKGNGKIWDSGKITSDITVNIEYAGPTLQSNTSYFWKVKVWDNQESVVSSEPASFQTGMLKNADWTAKWITTREEITDASPLLRNEFELDKPIQKATAYVTACGYYEFYLNGKKVGDHVLDPGITDYRKTILYSTYDVTDLLQKGTNAAGAMLGNAAWNMRKTEGRWSWGGGGSSLGSPCFLMQLMVTYKDGSQATYITDESWKTSEGPITFNNLYGGEDYDARKEIAGWAENNFDDSQWTKVAIASTPTGKLRSQLMPAIKVTKTIQPVKSIHPAPGTYLFDLGQNIPGWWKIKVQGTPGQVIRVRGAETLNDSLFSEPLKEGDKLSTKFHYHAKVWTDYTIKSNEPEIYEPHFFYTGFRYIEVTTSDNKNPELLEVEGRVVHSALEKNGTFESSNPLLNKIHEVGVWSQIGNTQSYPTDCPHREKGAYNGDGQVIAETSMHDFQMAPFYTKWLNDMRDSQEENGRIPNTSPVLVGGMGGGVAWGSAYILIPWWMHNYYCDSQILKEHYPSMKKYINYLKELGSKDEDPSEPYIIDNFDGYWYSLGEWCAPGQSDGPNHPVVNTFYYYYNCLLFSKIAEELGYSEDQKYYRALSDTIKREFNRKFFNTETALYGTNEPYQTYQLLALVGNMVPKGYKEKVFQTIIDDIKARDNHLNTGIIGTKYLWPILVKNGENETAYKIATQTSYPGYGYWLKNGATTLLERWEGANSHNHQMFGSITEYFYKFLAGIQSPMEGKTTAGYKHIYLEPKVPKNLESASATVKTVAGEISVSWKKEATTFQYSVSIPANTTATIILPTFDFKDIIISEGESEIWHGNNFTEGVSGIKSVKAASGNIEIQISSGDYTFTMKS